MFSTFPSLSGSLDSPPGGHTAGLGDSQDYPGERLGLPPAAGAGGPLETPSLQQKLQL